MIQQFQTLGPVHFTAGIFRQGLKNLYFARHFKLGEFLSTVAEDIIFHIIIRLGDDKGRQLPPHKRIGYTRHKSLDQIVLTPIKYLLFPQD